MISVIVPVYNKEKCLSYCLDSIIQNDYQDLEIICVNDGSTDNSLSELKRIAKIDNRITVIDSPHNGISNARNMGLEKASGDFIAFIDSDDQIHPQYFNTFVFWQKRTNADIVSATGWHDVKGTEITKMPINADTISVQSFKDDRILKNHLVRCLVWSKIYRRSLIGDIRFEPQLEIGEDACFNLDCFEKNKEVRTVLLDCRMYYYTYNDASASHTDRMAKSVVQYGLFLEKVKTAADKRKAKWYLIETLQRCIFYRYRSERDHDEHYLKLFQQLSEECIDLEREHRILPLQQSVFYQVIVKHPSIYRWYKNLLRKLKK